MAISVAGIITTIVMEARNTVKRGSSATNKLAKTLGKMAEKAAPVLDALLNLTAGILKLGAKAVGFLWLLALGKPLVFGRHDRVRVA